MNPQDPNQSADIQTPDGNFSQPVQTPPPVQSDAQPFAPASSIQPATPPVSKPSMSTSPSMNPVSQNIPISTSPIVQESNSNLQSPIQPQMTNNSGFSQPIVFGGQVKNHMALAIVSLFFSWPFGLVAIISASKVGSLLAAGDIARAEQASKKAKKWAIVAFVFFFVTIILVGLVLVIGFTGAGARKRAKEAAFNDLGTFTEGSTTVTDTPKSQSKETKSSGAIKAGAYTINKSTTAKMQGSVTYKMTLVVESVEVTEEKMKFKVAVTNNEVNLKIFGAGIFYNSYLLDDSNNQIDPYEPEGTYKKDMSDDLGMSTDIQPGATVRGWVSFPNTNKSSSFSFYPVNFNPIEGIVLK